MIAEYRRPRAQPVMVDPMSVQNDDVVAISNTRPTTGTGPGIVSAANRPDDDTAAHASTSTTGAIAFCAVEGVTDPTRNAGAVRTAATVIE
ncbi:MAG: hypothetical protein WBQ44_22795 [Rhodococcus sp. (in: high G+C Gram-positive bacteria)]